MGVVVVPIHGAFRPTARYQGVRGLVTSAVAAGPSAGTAIRAIRAEARRFGADVIHTNGTRAHVLAPWLGVGGTPTVATLHDLPQTGLERRLVTAALRRVDTVIANSSMVARAFAGAGCRVVDNPVAQPPARDRGQARARLGVPADAFVVASLSHFHWTKGQLDLVEAFARLEPGCHLVLAGGPLYGAPSTDYLQQVQEAAAASPARDRIHFVGLQDDVSWVYAGADVVAHCSRAAGGVRHGHRGGPPERDAGGGVGRGHARRDARRRPHRAPLPVRRRRGPVPVPGPPAGRPRPRRRSCRPRPGLGRRPLRPRPPRPGRPRRVPGAGPGPAAAVASVHHRLPAPAGGNRPPPRVSGRRVAGRHRVAVRHPRRGAGGGGRVPLRVGLRPVPVGAQARPLAAPGRRAAGGRRPPLPPAASVSRQPGGPGPPDHLRLRHRDRPPAAGAPGRSRRTPLQRPGRRRQPVRGRRGGRGRRGARRPAGGRAPGFQVAVGDGRPSLPPGRRGRSAPGHRLPPGRRPQEHRARHPGGGGARPRRHRRRRPLHDHRRRPPATGAGAAVGGRGRRPPGRVPRPAGRRGRRPGSWPTAISACSPAGGRATPSRVSGW